MKLTKQEEYAYRVSGAILDLLSNKESEFYIDPEEFEDTKNATDFVHTICTVAPAIVYSKLVDNDLDMLEFNHMANKLVLQNLIIKQ